MLSTDFSLNKGERGLAFVLRAETVAKRTITPVAGACVLVKSFKNGAERRRKTDLAKLAPDMADHFHAPAEMAHFVATPIKMTAGHLAGLEAASLDLVADLPAQGADASLDDSTFTSTPFKTVHESVFVAKDFTCPDDDASAFPELPQLLFADIHNEV